MALLAFWLTKNDRGPEKSQAENPAVENSASRKTVSSHLSNANAADAKSWLLDNIESSVSPGWKSPEAQAITRACDKLNFSEVISLLREIQGWRSTSSKQAGSNAFRFRMSRIRPLRECLLGRAARIDLRQALEQFPSDARVLVRAGARNNGFHAVTIWEAFRNEREGSPADFAENTFGWIEGVGEVPMILDTDPELKVTAALAEGWASAEPEMAWSAFTAGPLEVSTAVVLDGLFQGLPESLDWSPWADQLDSLRWNRPGGPFAWADNDPQCAVDVSFARRWLELDPNRAMDWFPERKASWPKDARASYPSDASSFNAGTTGRTRYVSAHVFLIADWIIDDSRAAGSWLRGANEAFAPKEVLREVISQMTVPEPAKLQISKRLGN